MTKHQAAKVRGMSKRYCEMCDRMVKGKECPLCGADTQPLAKAVPWPSKVLSDEGADEAQERREALAERP